MKRLLSFLSLLIVAVSSFAQEFTVGDLTYKILSTTNKTAQVYNGKNATGDVIVPEAVTYNDVEYRVTAVANYAFNGNNNITSVSLSSVTSIGSEAFKKCSSLTSVYLPSVTSVSSDAFEYCSSLAAVSLPSATTVGSWSFAFCSSLASVELPATTSVGSYAFASCTSLVSVSLPTATTINTYAFSTCQKISSLRIGSLEQWFNVNFGNYASPLEFTTQNVELYIGDSETPVTSIELPNTVTSIPDNAFRRTTITSVTAPAATVIGGAAFSSCSSLISVDLPAATSIGVSALSGCSSLVSVDLPAATSIGGSALSYCSSLTSVSLPAATSIGTRAFTNSNKISSLRIGSIEQWCNVNFEGDNANPLQNIYQIVELYIGDSETPTTSLEVPNTVTSIPNSAFRGTTITSVTAPAATSIGSDAFYGCSSLISVDLPAATSIGSSAFYGCSSLATVELSSATSIGIKAFKSCPSLASVSLPAATSIGSDAFDNYSSNISSLRIGSIEQWCNVNFEGDGANPLQTTSQTVELYIGNSDTPITEIFIPASVQQIPLYAFRNTDIHTIHLEGLIPPTLANTNSLPTLAMLAVPEEAYESYLAADVYKTIPLRITMDGHITKEVEIEADATTSKLLAKIGEDEVKYVVNLKIAGTINSYDMLIIRNQMPSLRNLDLTDVSIVDCDYVYSNANGTSYRSQKDVITAEWLTGVMNLKLPTSTKSIGQRAFYENKNLVRVSIPEGVTSIGNDAFRGCRAIKELTLPQSVTSFGSYAFYSCTGLKEVVIPNGTVSVGQNAFYGCTDLEKISIPESVVEIGNNAFCGGKPKELYISSLDAWLKIKMTGGSMTNYGGQYKLFDGRSFDNVAKLYIEGSTDPIENLTVPEGIEEINGSAFGGFKCLKSVTLPEGLRILGEGAFLDCSGLVEINIPQSLTEIKRSTFARCANLESIEFPDNIESIGQSAFLLCSKLQKVELPARLKRLDQYAFYGCSNLAEVLIPASITEIQDYAFLDCSNLNRVIATTVEPVKINQNTFSTYQTATLFTPKTSYYKYYWNTQYNQFLGGRKEYDKEFAKSFGYKYFYLNGMNGDNHEDFEISDETGPLHGVGDDNPDADFNEGAGMIVGGEQIQNLGDIHIHHNGNNGASVIAKQSGKVHIDNLYVDIKTQKNRWYFFCFPFDIKPGEATYDGSHVWYLYDGEARALNGNGGWKKLAADGVMKSGNGYIFQGAVNGTLTIHVSDITIDTNDASTNMITYQSDNKNDASWNLIGNANFAYYDIDNLGYDAPITVYNNETGNYEAVRAEDEDYEFYPFQAFFVQKPEGTESMDFDATKKETKNKSNENKARKAAARAGAPKKVDPSRQLINLELSAVDLTEDAETATAADRTRIVVNAAKSLAYEPECDAAKFIADGMPQIYSLDAENTMYAINERPAVDGIVPLAVKITEDGFYTISASRLDCAAQLRDLETGDVIDLAEGDYTFAAKAKTYTQRFQLLLADAVEGIEAIEVADAISVEAGAIAVNDQRADVKIYTAGGVLVAAQKGLGSVKVPAGVYVINVNGQSTKVSVNE